MSVSRSYDSKAARCVPKPMVLLPSGRALRDLDRMLDIVVAFFSPMALKSPDHFRKIWLKVVAR